MAIEFQPYIGAEIPPLANELQSKLIAEYDTEIPFAILAAWLSDYATVIKKENLKLSHTRPDFESLKQQLISRLRASSAWKDIITAGGGQTVIIDFFASIGEYGQTSILRAFDENAYDSARMLSSIYRITRSLGVHIDRKIPAQTQVALWGDNLADLAIPRLSQFTINGMPFFNRNTIMFNDNTETNPKVATLYQGEIGIETFTSNGQPFQSFELGLDDYSVANEDLYCFTDAQEGQYSRVLDGPWHYRNGEKIFWENTTPNGNVEILLGNGIYGNLPVGGTNLHFIYASTQGSAANTTQYGLSVALVSVNTNVPDRIRKSIPAEEAEIISTLVTNVKGNSISPIRGGDNEKDKEFYRYVGPSIRAAGKRTVSRRDHYAMALKFPGLVDVYFQGQRELGRTNRNYINVVGITTLKRDGTPLNDLEWASFVKYMEDLEIWRVNYIKLDPEPVPIDVSAVVYCTPNSDKTNVGSFLKFRFAEFLKVQRGSLGHSIYRNDIEDMLKFRYGDMNIDYAQVIEPRLDTILTRLQYPVIGNFDIDVQYSDRGYNIIPPRIIGSNIDAV